MGSKQYSVVTHDVCPRTDSVDPITDPALRTEVSYIYIFVDLRHTYPCIDTGREGIAPVFWLIWWILIDWLELMSWRSRRGHGQSVTYGHYYTLLAYLFDVLMGDRLDPANAGGRGDGGIGEKRRRLWSAMELLLSGIMYSYWNLCWSLGDRDEVGMCSDVLLLSFVYSNNTIIPEMHRCSHISYLHTHPLL